MATNLAGKTALITGAIFDVVSYWSPLNQQPSPPRAIGRGSGPLGNARTPVLTVYLAQALRRASG